MTIRAEEIDRFTETYRSERAVLARSVARMVGPDHADDLVHDAFVALLTRPPDSPRVGGWLARVVRNRAVDELRRSRSVALSIDPASDDAPPSRGSEREAVRSLVARALARVPERARHALELRFLESRPYEEVAEALGVPVAQAHLVVHRAVRRLGKEVVEMLARERGAPRCARALSAMTGVAAFPRDHGSTPCERCAPVWDEIVALRAAHLLVPLHGVPGLARRIAGEVVVRAPALAEPVGRAVSAIVALGMAVSTLAPRGAPEVPVVPRVERVAATTSTKDAAPARVSTRPRAGAVERATAGSVRDAADQIDPPPTTVATAPAVRVSGDDDHTRAEADPGGSGWTGVDVCKPLEPCPPS